MADEECVTGGGR